LSISVTVTRRDAASGRVILSCSGVNQAGVQVISGDAEVEAPRERVELRRTALPEVRLALGAAGGAGSGGSTGDGSGDGGGHSGLRRLLDHVRPLGRIRVAVVHPCDALSLAGALDAHAAGLIEPVLVAPRARLEAAAREAGADLADLQI